MSEQVFPNFDRVYEIDARHAYYLACAFCVARGDDVEQVFAALRMLIKTHDLDLFHYLPENAERMKLDDIGSEALQFCNYMREHRLVTWR